MSEQATPHGGSVPKKTKRVFLLAGTAYEGYALCYNWNAVGVTAEDEALTTTYGRVYTTTLGQWCDARNVQVEVPTHLNSQNFAGIVDRASDGVVGPNWIEVHEPGSACPVHCLAVVTLGTLASANKDKILSFQIGPTNNSGKYYYTGFPGEGAVKPLAELSTAAGLCMCELLTGEPSGGVFAVCTADSTISAASSSFNINVGGWTHVSVAGGIHADALLQLKDGVYEGERIGMKWTATTDKWLLISGVACAFSSIPGAAHNWKSPYRVQCTLSAANDYISLKWFGDAWWIQGMMGAVNSA